MKILYIVTSADLGGAQKSVLLLAKHFSGEIATGSEKTYLFDEARRLGVPTYRLKFLKRGVHPLYDFLALCEIYWLIKNTEPSIVHLNSSKAGFIGSIAGKLAGARVIFTARGFVFNEPHSWFVNQTLIGLEKFASLFRDHVITVSLSDEKSAKQHKIIDSVKLTTIHNSIEPIEYLSKEKAQELLNLNSGKLIIGTIANFYRTKGLDILIEAVSKLDQIIRDQIQIVIIGHGSLEQNLKLLTNHYSLQTIFRFAGQIPNASAYLKAFDIFVLPSRKEGFSLTLLEALQASLPIAATNVGGNSEAIGEAGILVQSQNAQALAESLTKLISDKELRENLAGKGIAQAAKFSPDKMFLAYEEIYRKNS